MSSSTADLSSAAIVEEAGCRRILSRYSAAVDWADEAALTSIFWPDALFDFGESFFQGRGKAGIDFLMMAVGASISRTHSLGEPWIQIEGETARAEMPAVNIWVSRNPDGSITRYLFSARYVWQLAKRSNEWRASSLRIIITTAQCTPYDVGAQPPGYSLPEGLGVSHPDYPGPHIQDLRP